MVGKREKVEFAETVDEFGRRFKPQKRDLILTGKAVWLIGREMAKDGPSKGKMIPVIVRKIDLDKISKVKNWMHCNLQLSYFHLATSGKSLLSAR